MDQCIFVHGIIAGHTFATIIGFPGAEHDADFFLGWTPLDIDFFVEGLALCRLFGWILSSEDFVQCGCGCAVWLCVLPLPLFPSLCSV